MQLEVLKLSDCGVEEIVANENGVYAVAIFLFPKLISLKLSKLGQLKRFYQGMYTSGCPLFKKLVVYNCDNVELHFQDKNVQGEVDKQPLFLVDEVRFFFLNLVSTFIIKLIESHKRTREHEERCTY